MENKAIKCGNKEFVLGQKAYIIGILNITPDSFSDGGLFFNHNNALRKALKMLDDGADIIDIGGESTSPFSKEVKIHEETR